MPTAPSHKLYNFTHEFFKFPKLQQVKSLKKNEMKRKMARAIWEKGAQEIG